MTPDVKVRYNLLMIMDHYTAQLLTVLTGHGDFRSKLYNFKLVRNPNCECGGGSETVRHVLLACKRTEEHRKTLEIALKAEGKTGHLRKEHSSKLEVHTKKFARRVLKNRNDR